MHNVWSVPRFPRLMLRTGGGNAVLEENVGNPSWQPFLFIKTVPQRIDMS